MLDRFYKLKYRLKGFVFLPSGGTMEITIPAGSLVNVLCAPASPRELSSVRCNERTYRVQPEELERCGTPVAREAE